MKEEKEMGGAEKENLVLTVRDDKGLSHHECQRRCSNITQPIRSEDQSTQSHHTE